MKFKLPKIPSSNKMHMILGVFEILRDKHINIKTINPKGRVFYQCIGKFLAVGVGETDASLGAGDSSLGAGLSSLGAGLSSLGAGDSSLWGTGDSARGEGEASLGAGEASLATGEASLGAGEASLGLGEGSGVADRRLRSSVSTTGDTALTCKR